MEQARRTRAHLERVLLVCGNQNAGKSRLLRSMLTDRRLGGVYPKQKIITARALSRERALAVRCTSPHEYGETPGEFHRKIDRVAAKLLRQGFFRFNYACAIQPLATNLMGDIVSVCDGLQKAFKPERIRVVQLVPDQWGTTSSQLTTSQVDGVRRLVAEVLALDARRGKQPADPANVRLLADYFDFS